MPTILATVSVGALDPTIRGMDPITIRGTIGIGTTATDHSTTLGIAHVLAIGMVSTMVMPTHIATAYIIAHRAREAPQALHAQEAQVAMYQEIAARQLRAAHLRPTRALREAHIRAHRVAPHRRVPQQHLPQGR